MVPPWLSAIRGNSRAQVALGLCFGIVFGFLLQKGGVTRYDVIIGQLLLTDFTVLKVMLAAVLVGMIGFHTLKSLGYVTRHIHVPSLGSNLVGGLIFGIGFALLGYCPGTVAGAAGQGSLDALIGGFIGLVVGAGIFVEIYPVVNRSILYKGQIKAATLPEFLKIRHEWLVVAGMAIAIIALLMALEILGW